MTYNTPELVSVGAAQNLVLGLEGKLDSIGRTNCDDGCDSYVAAFAPLDDSGW